MIDGYTSFGQNEVSTKRLEKVDMKQIKVLKKNPAAKLRDAATPFWFDKTKTCCF